VTLLSRRDCYSRTSAPDLPLSLSLAHFPLGLEMVSWLLVDFWIARLPSGYVLASCSLQVQEEIGPTMRCCGTLLMFEDETVRRRCWWRGYSSGGAAQVGARGSQCRSLSLALPWPGLAFQLLVSTMSDSATSPFRFRRK
jgi:hypothetical protein